MKLNFNSRYLAATKKGQVALLTTMTEVKLPKTFKDSIGVTKVEKIHSRKVQLNCNYRKRRTECRSWDNKRASSRVDLQ